MEDDEEDYAKQSGEKEVEMFVKQRNLKSDDTVNPANMESENQ